MTPHERIKKHTIECKLKAINIKLIFQRELSLLPRMGRFSDSWSHDNMHDKAHFEREQTQLETGGKREKREEKREKEERVHVRKEQRNANPTLVSVHI